MVHGSDDLNVLLVDPFVSAQYLSESFERLGVRTTALYTIDLDDVSEYHSPQPDYFDEQIRLGSRCMDAIVDALAHRRFAYVLNGSDGSTEVTDRVAQMVTPNAYNDPTTVMLRIDKRLMHEAAAEEGLTHLPQHEITHGVTPVDDSTLAGLNWPCFIKPSRGGGSVGVAKLGDRRALESYLWNVDHDKLLGNIRTSLPDDYSLKFLLSEYVEGRECFVDTFSYLGQHYISSIQAYTKQSIDNVPMYRSCEVITDRDLTKKLANYVGAILDSVGLANGFAHTEVFIKDDDEPVLIEINPRISGASGWHNRLAAAQGLPTQPELFAAVVSGERRDTNYIPPESVSARILFLSHLSTRPLADLAMSLQPFTSVQAIQQLKPVGYRHTEPPTSLSDLVGFVLCAGDANQLAEDCAQILSADLAGW